MRPSRLAILACLAQPLLAGGAFASGLLMQHRAVYDLALRQASERSGITGIDGRMVYELRGSACEGYTVRFRYVTQSNTSESTQLNDQRTTTFEEADGKSFRFATQSYLDQDLEKELRGSATLAPSGLTVKIDKPVSKTIELPKAHFPTQHLFELIDNAKRGKTFYETSIFDGSEDADKVMTTTVIVGKRTALEPGDPEYKVLGKLAGEQFWPVDIAYFDTEKQAGEVTPEYRISFKLYENGVTRDLEMDYGDFVIEGRLVGLTAFEPNAADCTR